MDRATAAGLLGVGARHFDESIRPNLSPESARGGRRELRFWAPDVVAAWVRWETQKLREQLREAQEAEDYLGLATDVKSPNLEKLRGIHVKRAQIELERLQGAVVDVAAIEGPMLALAEMLRQRGTILARRFGNEALSILDEGIADWEAGLAKLFTAKTKNAEADAGAGADGNAGAGAARRRRKGK